MSGGDRNDMDLGYFPVSSSVLRCVHSERAVGLNYGQRALMLGAAHPVNFIGTQANTRSGSRPFLRLAHTAKVFETIFFGSRAEADKALAFVDRLHQRVSGEIPEAAGPWSAGTSYTAFDGSLMLWTVAVIADSAQAFYKTSCAASATMSATCCGKTTCALASSSACIARRRPRPTRAVRPPLVGTSRGRLPRRRRGHSHRSPGGAARASAWTQHRLFRHGRAYRKATCREWPPDAALGRNGRSLRRGRIRRRLGRQR